MLYPMRDKQDMAPAEWCQRCRGEIYETSPDGLCDRCREELQEKEENDLQMGEMERASIMEMAKGAIMERIDYEMGKVLDNILDVNTRATAKRKITVTLDMIPSADRHSIAVFATAKPTLVPTEPVSINLCVAALPGTGEMVVAEMAPQIPGQIWLDGSEQEEPKVLKFNQQKAAMG